MASADAAGDKYLPDILIASLNGDERAVQELLARDSSLVNTRGGGNATPLHGAAFNGHVEVVKILLQNGGDVRAMTNNMETPAHWAAALGRKAVMEVLVAHGAELDAKDGAMKHTPLEKAKANNHIEVVSLLEDKQKIAELKGTSITNGSGAPSSLIDNQSAPIMTNQNLWSLAFMAVCCQNRPGRAAPAK